MAALISSFSEGRVRVENADAMTFLASLPEASIDVCVTDPPYGETSLSWDKRVPGWPALVRRVLKPHGSLWVFGSLRSLTETWGEFDGWRLAQDVVWEKHHGSGFGTDRFMRVHEIVAHLYPDSSPWERVYRDVQYERVRPRKGRAIRSAPVAHRGHIRPHAGYEFSDKIFMRSVIYARSCHGTAVHETQKPEAIIEPLIRYSCPPGGTVLDPFCGAGGVGVAAARNGRAFIGCDNRKTCCDTALERIGNDSPLFGSRKALPKAEALSTEEKDSEAVIVNPVTSSVSDAKR